MTSSTAGWISECPKLGLSSASDVNGSGKVVHHGDPDLRNMFFFNSSFFPVLLVNSEPRYGKNFGPHWVENRTIAKLMSREKKY